MEAKQLSMFDEPVPEVSQIEIQGFDQVPQADFYAKIGPLDVVLNTVGTFPYTTEFKMRHGELIGKVVKSYTTTGIGYTEDRYYLSV